MKKLSKLQDEAILKIKSELERKLNLRSIPMYAYHVPMINRAAILGFSFFTIIILSDKLVARRDLSEIKYCIHHELLHFKFNHVLKLFLISIFLPYLAQKKIIQYESQVIEILLEDKNGNT